MSLKSQLPHVVLNVFGGRYVFGLLQHHWWITARTYFMCMLHIHVMSDQG